MAAIDAQHPRNQSNPLAIEIRPELDLEQAEQVRPAEHWKYAARGIAGSVTLSSLSFLHAV